MEKEAKITQADRILEYIGLNGMIDRAIAAYDLGIFELAARIADLEKKGFVFEKTPVTRKNRFGDSFHCTEYRLVM